METRGLRVPEQWLPDTQGTVFFLLIMSVYRQDGIEDRVQTRFQHILNLKPLLTFGIVAGGSVCFGDQGEGFLLIGNFLRDFPGFLGALIFIFATQGRDVSLVSRHRLGPFFFFFLRDKRHLFSLIHLSLSNCMKQKLSNLR